MTYKLAITTRTRKDDNHQDRWFVVTCLRCNNTLKVRRAWLVKGWLRMHRFLCRGYVFPPLFED